MPRRVGRQGKKKNEPFPGAVDVDVSLIPDAKDFQISSTWIPVTPVKPILPKPHPICEDRRENQPPNWSAAEPFSTGFERGNTAQGIVACALRNSMSINKGFGNWEEPLEANFQVSGNPSSCREFTNLIALADAAVTTGDSTNATHRANVNAATGPLISINSNGFQTSLGNEGTSGANPALDTALYGNFFPSLSTNDLDSPPRAFTDAFLSRNIPSQFAPITPDQSKKAENKLTCDTENLDVDERPKHVRDKQGNEVLTTMVEVEVLHDKELQHLPKALTGDAVSTQLDENHNPDKGGHSEIDLNRTPQQKPRRKKHRPKVVVEGQPKRSIKPVTPKVAGSKANPRGKRKSVLKTELNKTPDTATTEVTSGSTDPKTASEAGNSCRRSLNFNYESQVREESSSCRPQSHINKESQAQNFYSAVESKSTMQLGQGMEVMVEKTQMGIAFDLTHSMSKVIEDYLSMPERQAPSPKTSTKTNQPQENLKVLVQNEDVRGKCQIVFLDETHDKQGSTKEVMMKTDNLSAPRSPNDSNCSSSTCLTEGAQARGFKRGHSCNIDEAEPSCTNVIGDHYNTLHEYMTMFPANIYDHNGIPGVHFPGICKKKRTEKVHSSSTSSPLTTLTASEQNLRQATPFPPNCACAARHAPEINCRFSAAQFNSSSTSAKTAPCLDAQGKQHTFECKLALDLKGRTMTKKRSKAPTRVRDLTSLIGIVGCRQLSTFPAAIAPTYGNVQGHEISNQPHTCMEALVADTRAAMTTKKTTKKRTKRNSFATSVTTDEILKGIPTIDKIVEKLKSIDLNRECNQITAQQKGARVPYNLRYEEKNALVLYRRDGTVVPFEGSFDPVKKRRPRPKVDLDDETNRVWKLLLENINSEGIDGTDEEKAKWWEDERTVFQGRADSFIARMHLVQGDRRFSPWKGSIVDSVVGVFLTQNVSDHLSSSAFMSLAARFPLKSESGEGSCSEETIVLAKEPEVLILEPEETIKWHEKKSDQLVCERISVILHDVDYNIEKEVVNSNELLGSSSADEKSTDNFKCKSLNISGNGPEMNGKPSTDREMLQLKEAMATFMEDKREMDDVLTSQYSAGSSQNSVDSSMSQTAERISPCLQDNSETDLATWSNPNSLVGSFVELLQWAETSRGFYDHGTGNVSSCTENGHTYLESTECGTHKQNKDGSENPNASSCNNYHLQITPNSGVPEVESLEILEEESLFSHISKKNEENCTSEQSGVTAESVSQAMAQNIMSVSSQETPRSPSENNHACRSLLGEANKIFQSQNRPCGNLKDNIQLETQEQNCRMQQVLEVPNLSRESLDIMESTSVTNDPKNTDRKQVALSLKDQVYLPGKAVNRTNSDSSKLKRARDGKQKQNTADWDSLRLQAQAKGKRGRTTNTMDSLDWEAVRCADVGEIANTIKDRGMNNMLAERIKDFLNRLVREHGSIDLEWLRDVPPDKAKEYLLSIRGLGLKSVECVRLLTLHHLAFPVDTNVGRIAVRLGWVPLQPLPESLQLHLLELYPVLESIQRYLWPRLCKLDQRTLYELHYQMITFGKVFCTKSKPNCNACPMRGECRHFASAFASARLALPGPEEKSIVCATENKAANQHPVEIIKSLQLPLPEVNQQLQAQSQIDNCEPVVAVPTITEPIIEVPATPEPDQPQVQESDIEDTFYEDPDEIPTIKLNIEEFTQNLQNYMQKNMELQEADMSKALVALTPEAASIPMPKLKNVSRLRTEHQVYELPDSHPLLEGLDKREPDDPCSYLLAIWTPGETANSIQPPEIKCSFQEFGQLCDEKTCFSCNSIREANSQMVRGTLLIPCRTAMRGSFPLNGTYFQVNEVFADHESSINPIDVPRTWIWNLPRRTVYFGTSIPTIFKGLTTESIQYCFWRGFVCVRGFDQKTRAPRPLMARLHFPASKLTKTKGKTNDKQE